MVSSNIVGYQKLTLSAGYTIVGSQFLNVGGTTKDIQELVANGENTLPGIDEQTYEFHANLRVWDGVGYDTYGWSDADDGDSIDWSESNSKWLDQKQENIVNVTIGIGKGFWIYTDRDATITFQ